MKFKKPINFSCFSMFLLEKIPPLGILTEKPVIEFFNFPREQRVQPKGIASPSPPGYGIVRIPCNSQIGLTNMVPLINVHTSGRVQRCTICWEIMELQKLLVFLHTISFKQTSIDILHPMIESVPSNSHSVIINGDAIRRLCSVQTPNKQMIRHPASVRGRHWKIIAAWIR